ncbi:Uncharacterised protein [uncultured archaeon]|nr:Uncharacterised protein [uncultured archaeon]
MDIRLAKTKGGVILSGEIPQEISDSPSLELFPLRNGAYLLTVKGFIPGAASAQQKKAASASGKSLTDAEKALLRKLLSIKFESRVPLDVAKLFTKEEKELLEGLVKSEMVQVFHGGKYEKSGVYNVSDFAFNAVREPAQAPSAVQPPAPSADIPVSSAAHLEKHGWMILANETEARNFGNAYPDKVKSGEVMGQRAFDRQYYFVTKAFFASHEKEIMSSLGKSDKTPEELSQQLHMAPEGCRALLVHLLETGDVMEKRKGKFSRA